MDWFHRNLRKVRPAPLVEALKSLLRIRRRVVKTRTGHRFWLDPVSHFGGEILETGSYEAPLTALIGAVLRPGDVFIDVGANEGYFSVLASGLVGSSGKVFSIEPQSRLFPVLRKNLDLLYEDTRTRNITLTREALSDRAGELTLHLAPSTNSGGTSVHRAGRFTAGTETVPMRSLDEFFRANGLGRVRLIKLDCEGAELSIVRGATAVLAEQRADFISIDFHQNLVGREAGLEIDRRLRANGYLLSRAGNGLWIYHRPELQPALRSLGEPAELPPIQLEPLTADA